MGLNLKRKKNSKQTNEKWKAEITIVALPLNLTVLEMSFINPVTNIVISISNYFREKKNRDWCSFLSLYIMVAILSIGQKSVNHTREILQVLM